MARSRIIFLTLVGGGLLFGVALLLTVWPGVSDVSDNPALRPLLHRPLLHRPLQLRRPATLYATQAGEHLLCPNVLTEDAGHAGRQLARLPVGTTFTLRQFKYYEERESSSITLVGLGTVALPSGVAVPFEYAWGRANSPTNPAAPPALPDELPLWAAAH